MRFPYRKFRRMGDALHIDCDKLFQQEQQWAEALAALTHDTGDTEMSFIAYEVESDTIESLGYYADIEELAIVYKSGEEVRHRKVPPSTLNLLIESDDIDASVERYILEQYESYDPTRRLPDDALLGIVGGADKLNALIDELAADLLPGDPAAEPINRLQGALDTYANRLESIVRERQ